MFTKVYKLKIKRFAMLLTVVMLIGSVLHQPLVSTATEPEPSVIHSDGAGFITTEGMMDKRIDEITFAEAHNAFANNVDGCSLY